MQIKKLYKALKIVRNDMMTASSECDGTFAVDCREKSVPRPFFVIVSMLLFGPDIITEFFWQEMLSIARMLESTNTNEVPKTCKLKRDAVTGYLEIVTHCEPKKRKIADLKKWRDVTLLHPVDCQRYRKNGRDRKTGKRG